jgi:hypothetical protein
LSKAESDSAGSAGDDSDGLLGCLHDDSKSVLKLLKSKSRTKTEPL